MPRYTIDAIMTDVIRRMLGELPAGFSVEADSGERLFVFFGGERWQELAKQPEYEQDGSRQRVLCGTTSVDGSNHAIRTNVNSLIVAAQKLLPVLAAA
jgi:hypothetical protein